MVRVLRPGGYLYCSVEGLGYDLHLLKQARSGRQMLSQVRDLVYGLMLAATGAQPTPGKRLSGGRASGTIRRCRQMLSRAGCEVVYAEATSRPLGLPLAFDLAVRVKLVFLSTTVTVAFATAAPEESAMIPEICWLFVDWANSRKLMLLSVSANKNERTWITSKKEP